MISTPPPKKNTPKNPHTHAYAHTTTSTNKQKIYKNEYVQTKCNLKTEIKRWLCTWIIYSNKYKPMLTTYMYKYSIISKNNNRIDYVQA
jgi:hypothetical protein